MIYPKYLGNVIFVLAFVLLALPGLRAQDHAVPLKNWATPLYWHPNQAERETIAKPSPQFQLSTNAVSTDALTFVAVTPCRLVDTRGASAGFMGDTPFNGPSIPSGQFASFPVQSSTEAATSEPAPCGTVSFHRRGLLIQRHGDPPLGRRGALHLDLAGWRDTTRGLDH